MTKKKNFREKLKKIIKDEKLVSEIENLFNEEVDSEIVKYNSSFENYFFAKTYCNKEECDVTYSSSIYTVIGYLAEQIEELPNKLNSIIHEDDRLRIENGMTEFFNDNEKLNISISYRIIDKNDDIIYLNESISAKRNKSGKVTEYNSIFYNISEVEKEKNNISELCKELRNLNRVKDKFISIVSHDLKSPYTTLLGFSEILLNDNSLPDEEKLEYLTYIHSSSEHQLNLIEHLLDWSRMRTGRTEVEGQRLNLKNLISTVVSKFTGLAIRKNIEISQNVKGDIFINSNEKQLSKAISDLLQNAIHFSNKDSAIFIYGSRFKNGMIEVIIKDKGIGISADDQDRLFKLEHKHSREGTEGEQGSGMGLILVKEIMEKLKGDVWFYSKENEGSEFHITIPEAKNLVIIIDEKSSLSNSRSKAISEILPDYTILTANNAYEAMDFVSEELPSLILVNDSLPLLSGDEFIKLIRSKDKYFSVCIFVFTNRRVDEVEKRYDSFMIDGVYKNSIKNDELIKEIKKKLK
ncbi:MAG: ATP-binding protein [Melioribacteraceae bacterium]|nr:ATP-binding protein [Melioribacteraceae bacterium]